MKELSLVLIKPDGVELSLTGEILSHLDMLDIILVGSKVVKPNIELLKNHYFEHRNKPFFNDIINYMMGKYHNFNFIYAFCYYGEDACTKIRDLAGKTNPMDKDGRKKITTIRQKYGKNVIVTDDNGNEIIIKGHTLVRFENVIHASYSDKAEYEVKLWFNPSEIVEDYRLYEWKKESGENLVWTKGYLALRKEIFGE
ncbi:MAG: nucleoside-diphosphate kinase [Spirochaetes bacterium]|nr:nucleoside-diphosphate kinase [Spirochaetota bacterium]